MAVLVLLISQAPSSYLGFALGNWYYYEGIFRDSLAGDPMKDYDLYDTTKILEEFTYNGHHALSVYVKDSAHSDTWGDTLMIKGDTVYDSIPWLMLLTDIGGATTVTLRAYKIPFTVGESWSTGLAGKYAWDIDGDLTPDTVIVRVDSAYVQAQEVKVVPAGSFNCFKIYVKTRASVTWVSGSTDTGQIKTDRYEWWCVDTGMIADTSFTQYIGYYGNIPIPLYYEWRTHNLVDYYVGVAESPKRPSAFSFTVQNTDKGVRFVFGLPTEGEGTLSVYEISGREVESVAFSGVAGENSIAWSGKPGVYSAVLRFRGRMLKSAFVIR
ncbi:MAG: hypothetical protein ABIN54_08650 [candidate division WOR-3 bacterium]